MARLKYLLDSNILSEPTRQQPNAGVRSHRHHLCVAAPVLHELRYGLHRIPDGARKQRLTGFLAELLHSSLAVLPYDRRAALWHAHERARLVALGRTPAYVDGQIAAVAATNDLTLVTRNARHFTDFVDLRVENWFD